MPGFDGGYPVLVMWVALSGSQYMDQIYQHVLLHTWWKALFSATFSEDQIQRPEENSDNKHRERLHSSIVNVE